MADRSDIPLSSPAASRHATVWCVSPHVQSRPAAESDKLHHADGWTERQKAEYPAEHPCRAAIRVSTLRLPRDYDNLARFPMAESRANHRFSRPFRHAEGHDQESIDMLRRFRPTAPSACVAKICSSMDWLNQAPLPTARNGTVTNAFNAGTEHLQALVRAVAARYPRHSCLPGKACKCQLSAGPGISCSLAESSGQDHELTSRPWPRGRCHHRGFS